jgi:tight adherence protein B
VRTKTAEGRAQALLIALAPFALVPLLDALDPNFLAPLWQTELGHLLVGLALALWLAALWLARRITAVDI